MVHYSKLVLKLGADIVEQNKKCCTLSDTLPFTIEYTGGSQKNTVLFIANTENTILTLYKYFLCNTNGNAILISIVYCVLSSTLSDPALWISPLQYLSSQISTLSLQLSTTQTPLHFKVKDAKHWVLPPLLLHAYSFHFTPVSPNSLLAICACLYLPTSLAPILFPSVSSIFTFVSPMCLDISTRLPDPCLSSSFWCRVGVRWDNMCAGKRTFPNNLFFPASSDPFLMAKICLIVCNCATFLLDIYLLCASAS